jgi:hypothetical protein
MSKLKREKTEISVCSKKYYLINEKQKYPNLNISNEV